MLTDNRQKGPLNLQFFVCLFVCFFVRAHRVIIFLSRAMIIPLKNFKVLQVAAFPRLTTTCQPLIATWPPHLT